VGKGNGGKMSTKTTKTMQVANYRIYSLERRRRLLEGGAYSGGKRLNE
jgi:hypothetical protein